MEPPRDLLRSLFDAALAAVDPRLNLGPALPEPPLGRLVVVGAGKAGAPMALVAAERYGAAVSGLVVVPPGHGLRDGEDAGAIRLIEGDHPTPGAASLAAGAAMLEAVSGLGEDDLVVCLLSGGGSALAEAPIEGLSLAALQALTRSLLESGATVAQINTVRKHLSRLKGGRLAAAAWPARVETFAVSDVVGDAPEAIASGPTVADPSSLTDAEAVLARYGLTSSVPLTETPKPGDPRLSRTRYCLVGTPRMALEGAASLARDRGFEVADLGDAVEGEAADVARDHAGLALQLKGRDQPTVILSGGELTVSHDGRGSGGPNREYALALALALDGAETIHALAADSDGVDGASTAAGAHIDPHTLMRARALGLDAALSLASHDSGPFFAALGDALVTGPTRTNVSDFRAILVGARSPP